MHFSFFLLLFFALFLPFQMYGASNKIDLQADAFEYDATKTKVIASGNVVVTQADIKIFGKTAVYLQDLQKTNLKGQIRIEKGALSMTCDQVTALGKENLILATGNVRFNYKNVTGESDSALYNTLLQHVELTGSPKVKQGSDELTGQLISVDLKSNKVRTVGRAKAKISLETVQKP